MVTSTMVASGAVTPTPPSATPSSTGSGPKWTVHQSSSTGLIYYFDAATSKTQWTEPDDFDSTYTDWQLEVLKRTKDLRTIAATGGIIGLQAHMSSVLASPTASGSASVGGSGATPLFKKPVAQPLVYDTYVPVPSIDGREQFLSATSSYLLDAKVASSPIYDDRSATPSSAAISSPEVNSLTASYLASFRSREDQLQKKGVTQSPLSPPPPVYAGGLASPTSSSSGPLNTSKYAAFAAARSPASSSSSSSSTSVVPATSTTTLSPSTPASALSPESRKAPPGTKTVAVGRNGWAAAANRDGFIYYFHANRGLTQWNRPEEY